jgi:hypothetical protein
MQVPNRYSKESNKKGWIRGVILVIAWILIISLVKDLWQIKSGFARIQESNIKLQEEQKKNQELKDKLSLVSTDEYKERLIREQLNMQKVGEVVAVLPKEETSINADNNKIGAEKTDNWEKWWTLLK